MGTVEFALLAINSIVAVMEPASTVAVYVTLTKDMASNTNLAHASFQLKSSEFIA